MGTYHGGYYGDNMRILWGMDVEFTEAIIYIYIPGRPFVLEKSITN